MLQASVAGVSRQVDPISPHPLKELPMLKINNRKRADLLEDLKKKGFKAMSEIMKGSLGTFSTFKF